MTDARMQKMGKILVEYSTKIRKGDWVIILVGLQGLDLAREVTKQATLAGGNVSVIVRDRSFDEILFKYGTDEQAKWLDPFLDLTMRKADVLIQIIAPDNTRTLNSVDPEKQQINMLGQREAIEIYMKRSSSGDLRWNITQAPCLALAQDAGMSLADFEDFVYAATFADQDDPIDAWEKVEKDQARLVQWLADKKEIKIQSPNADLTLSIEGRRFINSTGTVNLPSGEIFTSPVEDSANGWVQFTYPAIHQGREVEGVRLEFENGKVVKASAVKNEDFLMKMLDIDAGARYLGELGIGTNFGIKKFTRSILYDEKIGGTFHLALGHGFDEIGAKNDSTIHWDLISDAREGGRMWADGILFYENGKFVI